MYTRNRKDRFRYIEVAIMDTLCLLLAFYIAYSFYIGYSTPYKSLYRALIIFICLSNFVVVNLLSSYEGFERRGYYKEFVALFKQTALVFLLVIFYLFTVKDAHKFSRIGFAIMISSFLILDYCLRLAYKKLIESSRNFRNQRALLIVVRPEDAKKVLDLVIGNSGYAYDIKGFVLTGKKSECDNIGGYPVVCAFDDLIDYVCQNWVDDVLFASEAFHGIQDDILEKLSETGVVLHVALSKINNLLGQKQTIETYDGYNVITSSMNQANAIEVFIKRTADILGGLVGCVITFFVYLAVAPIIKRQSPGPVFFSQKRVGRNGKVFTMYKFRSMVMDAEERKKDMVAANRVSDGMMFKMDFDPRIIGNEELPDGTRKTGIGEFIRRTSIDELPQFFNVLKGDMSLVGTRPPTLDEWEKYELHHRARLAIRPGITGMWQVSGRSEITDFEEVVALDTKYINEWSLGLDIKILMKTVRVVFKGEGAL